MTSFLPFIGVYPDRGSKRPAALDFEQSVQKKQFAGKAYDELQAEALRVFGPALFACATEGVTLEVPFSGTLNGAFAQMRLRLFGRVNPLTQALNQRRVFVLTFFVDVAVPRRSGEGGSGGAVEYQTLPDVGVKLKKVGVSNVQLVQCGLSVAETRQVVNNLMGKWLDFAQQTYVLG